MESDLLVWLKEATRQKATDLILTAGLPPVLKADKKIIQLSEKILDEKELREIVYSFLSEEQQKAFEFRKELDISLALPQIGRFRINVFKHRKGVGAVFRTLPVYSPRIEDLGLPKTILQLLEKEKGLIIVAGPTGSGKSTSLAAMVDYINRNRFCHIVTIEDPVEFVHHSIKGVVHQREVGWDTKDFAQALRAALRQSPDVIMVGEIRDRETARAVLSAAESAHLVLTSVHGSSAQEIVGRLVNLFPEGEKEEARNRLASALLASLSQKLLPKQGGGLVLAYELMLGSPSVKQIIREGKPHMLKSVIMTSSEQGMIPLEKTLAMLYQRRLISYEVGLESADDPKEFSKLCSTARSGLLERNSPPSFGF